MFDLSFSPRSHLLSVLLFHSTYGTKKLRKSQRGEGIKNIVTYRYVYVEGEGVTGDTQFEKMPYLIF